MVYRQAPPNPAAPPPRAWEDSENPSPLPRGAEDATLAFQRAGGTQPGVSAPRPAPVAATTDSDAPAPLPRVFAPRPVQVEPGQGPRRAASLAAIRGSEDLGFTLKGAVRAAGGLLDRLLHPWRRPGGAIADSVPVPPPPVGVTLHVAARSATLTAQARSATLSAARRPTTLTGTENVRGQ